MELTELEDAIRAAPDDLALRQVYADALLDRGDPRGDHLVLAARDPESWELWELERGVTERLVAPVGASFALRLRWRGGFVDEVRVTRRRGGAAADLAALRELLEQRELAALRTLDLRGAWTGEDGWVEAMVGLVDGTPVRRLGFGSAGVDARGVDAVLEGLPRLDGLRVGFASPHEDGLDALARWPRLRALDVHAPDVEPARVVERLRHLDLERFAVHSAYGFGASFDAAGAFAPILRGEAMPNLVELGFFGELAETMALSRAVVASPVCERLTGFGMCAAAVYDDAGAQAWFVANAERFARCELFTAPQRPGDAGFECGRLGLLLLRLGRGRDGIAELAHHVDVDGAHAMHASCWAELGECYVAAGRADLALAPIDRALAFGPGATSANDLVQIWRTRAAALVELRRWDDAIAACRAALARDRHDVATWHTYELALRGLPCLADASLAGEMPYLLEHADPTAPERARREDGVRRLLDRGDADGEVRRDRRDPAT